MRIIIALLLTAALLHASCSDRYAAEPDATRAAAPADHTNPPASADATEPTTMPEKVTRTDEEWREILTPEQYRIAREKGTERAFTGEYYDTKTPGTYLCVCCGQALFESSAKYDSGCGWPSFWQPMVPQTIDTQNDTSLFMTRTEVLCSRCGAHLGHVFDDGPQPTGLRYCINSASLKLQPEE